MRTAFTTSPFIPPEWLAVHGFRPVLAVPATPTPHQPAQVQGMCPFARAQLSALEDTSGGDVVIWASHCDQMRRAAELRATRSDAWFFTHLSATWGHDGISDYYIDELRRLGRFLVSRGGTHPSWDALRRVMLDFDRRRRALGRLRERLEPSGFARALLAFHRGQPLPEISPESRSTAGVPLALVGCPLTERELALFDLIEAAGGRVALDATELGELALVFPLDSLDATRDPLTVLAERTLRDLPGVFRRPDSALIRGLIQAIEARGARGILFVRWIWCDLWHAVLASLQDRIDLPVLDLQVSAADDGMARAQGRIEAFVEMLR